jgi:galactokinase
MTQTLAYTALQGVLNRFFHSSKAASNPVPVDLLVTGTVPAGSGLSSSAAMVVASTLAFLAVNDSLEGLSKGTLVDMAVENEKRVGVNSGG